MKITTKSIEQDSIGEFDEIKSTINKNDLGFALGALSKNLYSNPIGSFIRELASNAVDANVDANIDSPIIICIYKEEDIWYISFTDEGTGISPKNFKNIYMSWFNSDKRDTNDKIGGWGLGSKSPLGYQDDFQIDTIYNNVEYHYVMVNQSPVPTATLISSDTVEKHNGTTITVEIKEGDENKVLEECKKQLIYFNNVIVKTEYGYYNNHFSIYEAKDFKIRNDKYPFNTEMHISLGQVAYPINWAAIGLERVEIPVGIKFEVGSLPVTLSREGISYSDEEVKNKIKIKVLEIYKSLEARYQKQLKINDFKEYIDLVTTSNYRNSDIPLKIEELEIPVEFNKVRPSFAPLDIIFKISKLLDIFSYYEGTKIVNGKTIQDYVTFRDVINGDAYLATGNFNTYDSLYINSGYVFKRKKLNKYLMRKIANAANLTITTSARGKFSTETFKEGAAVKIYKLIKIIDAYVIAQTKSYNGVAPDWWIEDYKEQQRQLAEDRKGIITSYSIYGSRVSKSFSEYLDKYKFILYIDKNADYQELLNYSHLISILPNRFKKDIKFLILSPSTINKYKPTKKRKSILVPVENIFKVKSLQNFFFKMKLSGVVNTFLRPYAYCYVFNKNYNNIYSKITELYSIGYKTSDNINLLIYFYSKLYPINRTKNRTHYLYEEYFTELEEFGKSVEEIVKYKSTLPQKYLGIILRNLPILKIDDKYKLIN